MNIKGLCKTTTIDFPGKLAAVVFTAGCNYRCGYCHNKEYLTEEGLLHEDEVLAFLIKRSKMLEGVVVTGGEPTLQQNLLPFLRDLRALGYEIKLDTNGSHPEVLSAVLQEQLAQYVAMDYKAPFERYPAICKSSAAGVRECLQLLFESNIEWELRTTVIPSLSVEDILFMGKEVPALPRYALQLYRPVQGEPASALYTPAQLVELQSALLDLQPHTIVRS